MESLIKALTLEDLPNEDLQFLANVIGLEAVKKLMTACAGMTFYVPIKLQKDFHKRYIEQHYDQSTNNVRPISRILGISEQTVWRLLREKAPKARGVKIPGPLLSKG